MKNNKLTGEQIALWRADAESVLKNADEYSSEYAAARAISELTAELQEYRNNYQWREGIKDDE